MTIQEKQAAQRIAQKFNLPIHRLPEQFKDIADYLPTINGERFKNEIQESLTDWKTANNVNLWGF